MTGEMTLKSSVIGGVAQIGISASRFLRIDPLCHQHDSLAAGPVQNNPQFCLSLHSPDLHPCHAFVTNGLPGIHPAPSVFWDWADCRGDPRVFRGQGVNVKGYGQGERWRPRSPGRTVHPALFQPPACHFISLDIGILTTYNDEL